MDSACVNIAQNMKIDVELKAQGILLEAYSARMMNLLNEGYVPVTF